MVSSSKNGANIKIDYMHSPDEINDLFVNNYTHDDWVKMFDKLKPTEAQQTQHMSNQLKEDFKKDIAKP
jgi:hypothetical protein